MSTDYLIPYADGIPFPDDNDPSTETAIEKRVYELLIALDAYDVTLYYGAADPIQLYEFIESRLSAGQQSAFIRIEQTQAEQIDTIGLEYNNTYQLEVITAIPINDRAIPQGRATYSAARQVKAALLGKRFSLNHSSHFLSYINTSYLFRVDNHDITLIRFEMRGINEEFDEETETP